MVPSTSAAPVIRMAAVGISLPKSFGGVLNTMYNGNSDMNPASVTQLLDEFMNTYRYENSHSIAKRLKIVFAVGFANGMAAPIQNMKIGKTRSTQPIPGTDMFRSWVGGGFCT